MSYAPLSSASPDVSVATVLLSQSVCLLVYLSVQTNKFTVDKDTSTLKNAKKIIYEEHDTEHNTPNVVLLYAKLSRQLQSAYAHGGGGGDDDDDDDCAKIKIDLENWSNSWRRV